MPHNPRVYFVYILSSLSGTLYVGVTNNLHRRVAEHRIGSESAFTARYAIDRLVYFECFGDILKAIAREKQLKSWRREKKVALIKATNPSWRNLRNDLWLHRGSSLRFTSPKEGEANLRSE
jgi:putative endonuclease